MPCHPEHHRERGRNVGQVSMATQVRCVQAGIWRVCCRSECLTAVARALIHMTRPDVGRTHSEGTNTAKSFSSHDPMHEQHDTHKMSERPMHAVVFRFVAVLTTRTRAGRLFFFFFCASVIKMQLFPNGREKLPAPGGLKATQCGGSSPPVINPWSRVTRCISTNIRTEIPTYYGMD